MLCVLQGFLKEAIINYLATLGWNDGTEKEIYSPDELVEAFRLERIVKAPSMFDMTKLRWINAQHMRRMSVHDLKDQLAPFLLESKLLIEEKNIAGINDKFLEIAVNLSCSKIEVLCDAIPIIKASLQYPLLQSISENAEAQDILNDEFDKVVVEVLKAWEEGTLPSQEGEDFETAWKSFVKHIGKTLGRKGISTHRRPPFPVLIYLT